MGWEIEIDGEFERGTLTALVDRAVGYLPDKPTRKDIEEATLRAIDEGCGYYATKLAVVQYFGFASEAFELAEEDLFWMVSDAVEEEVEED